MENCMAEEAKTGGVNHTLDRRRDEKATEQVMQENVSRMSDLAINGMEVGQKVLGLQASVFNFWADHYSGLQNVIGHMVSTTQKSLEQIKRAS
jgi:xylose isomerase